MKNISILGSTGSIGTQTLEVVRANKDIKVVAMSAGRNIRLLEQQIREFSPLYCSVEKEEDALELKRRLSDRKIEIGYGMEGLIRCAVEESAELIVTAIVGMIGILPTVEGIKAGKSIALANKETLVAAGHIIMPLVKKHKVNLYPVDSEHSAIFQALRGEAPEDISKIILTASGGPFLGRKRSELKEVTVQEALKHPNWSMGKKITIDSATMVNKGLEIIEAKWLFEVSLSQIQVIVQPKSIIHSMVEFVDGAVMAQLGTPDMRLPIQYALYYPRRPRLNGERLDFEQIASLRFEKPDMETFLGLKYAYQAAERGGSTPAALNAANEKAVQLFLNQRISFLEIYDIIEYANLNHRWRENPTISDILELEQEVYELIETKFGKD